MPETMRITYKKSAIGYSQRQKDTIRSLGFKRLGQTLEVADNPATRGMVHSVQHLVAIETIETAGSAGGAGESIG